MATKTYTNTGICIWCGKKFPEVSFQSKPHVFSKRLGGDEIGLDICDDCNHYFGTATQGKPSIDMVFKEIFDSFRFFCDNLTENSYKNFHSSFFSYRHNQGKVVIKKNFKPHIITRLFKRSLYNVFLQKYHLFSNDGNNPKFKMIRDFARYDIGNPKVFYAYNNIIFEPKNKSNPSLMISQKSVDDIDNYGMYRFWFLGHIFYLEVLPVVFNVKGRQFLQDEANKMLICANGNESIFEFNDIMEIDFLMQRFNT